MEISLRPVEQKDIGAIYAWINHPQIRKNSFDSNEIGIEEHGEYWKGRLAGADYSFVIVSEDGYVGLLRLDKKEDAYEVSILIAPGFQGKGLGTRTVEEAKKFAKKAGIRKLTARVLPGNDASHAIFRNGGFVEKYSLYECEL